MTSISELEFNESDSVQSKVFHKSTPSRLIYRIMLIDDGFKIELAGNGNRSERVLNESEFLVLEYLLTRSSKICSRDELIKYAWPGRVVSQGSLNQVIFALRSIFSNIDADLDIIQTVPRRGYKALLDEIGQDSEHLLGLNTLRTQQENKSSSETSLEENGSPDFGSFNVVLKKVLASVISLIFFAAGLAFLTDKGSKTEIDKFGPENIIRNLDNGGKVVAFWTSENQIPVLEEVSSRLNQISGISPGIEFFLYFNGDNRIDLACLSATRAVNVVLPWPMDNTFSEAMGKCLKN